MYHTISSFDEFQNAVVQNKAALFYFSHNQCNVYKVLKPKIFELINGSFPQIVLFYCNTSDNPDIAAQNSVFTVPTITIFFEGKELIRKSRNFGIEELSVLIERPYNLVFG